MKRWVDHPVKPRHLPGRASHSRLLLLLTATAYLSALFAGGSVCRDGLVASASNGKHWLRK